MKRIFLVLAAFTAVASTASAQGSDSIRVTVGGVIYANYQYRTRPADAANRFDVDRAYITLRGPLGSRTSFRVTTDVFQNDRDTVNRSWTVRAKYAYVQYDYLRTASWNAWTRLGLIQTVFIEHDESFWPRWLGTTPTDRHGYFSSADGGISTNFTLPNRRGEMYVTVTNGPGFGSREQDRFKDVAARLTVTPFAARRDNPFRSLAVSAWAYEGATASRFVRGGTGQVGPVGSALRRDRWGVFAALAHPRLTAAVQHARRTEEGESGANTPAAPRVVTDSSGSVTAGYVIARPFAGPSLRKLGIVGRWDHVTTNRDAGRNHDLVIGGIIWDLSSRVSASLDFQNVYPDRGSGTATAEARTLFLHAVASF